MSKYNQLLRERALVYIDDLYRLDSENGRDFDCSRMMKGCWGQWHQAIDLTSDLSDETLEQICIEMACQTLIFLKRRPGHYPLLSAINDRHDAVNKEIEILDKIKMSCVEV